MVFQIIATTVIAYIFFEAFKEFYLVSSIELVALRTKYWYLKDESYSKYQLITIYFPIFRALKKPKVILPLVFFLLHEYFIHELLNGTDPELFKDIAERGSSIGLYLAAIYAFVLVLKEK